MGLFDLFTGAVRGAKNAFTGLTEDPTADAKRAQLEQQGVAAGNFADAGQQGYGATSAEAAAARQQLRDIAEGRTSLSREQLRQGLDQNVAAQRSFAASASPQNAAMAARNAMMNAGRLGAGLSGQAAMAGIAERQAAAKAYNDAILAARGQDIQVGLGSRQNAIAGFGGITPEGSVLDKWANPIGSAAGAYAKFSDKRLKEDIEDGDSEANKALQGLKAYSYKYRDKKLSTNGGKSELGIMAQDLEKAGLKHAVVDTPRGKAVHGAALATANTAMLSALARRVERIEGKGKK